MSNYIFIFLSLLIWAALLGIVVLLLPTKWMLRLLPGLKKQEQRSFTVEIRQMKFDPEEIIIRKGDTVIWRNNDEVSHCLAEQKNNAWTSAEIRAGATWKKVFAQSAAYYCVLHPGMKGKITVQ